MKAIDRAVKKGASLDQAKKAMIMVHGRGASAQGILDLQEYFDFAHIAYLAPQAIGGSWYPYGFMAPMNENEPGLSRALSTIDELLQELEADFGLKKQDIYLLGFSQGACLSLEYAARHAGRYAGIFALSGGLIGPEGSDRNYPGDFAGTPVLLGCSDVDFHIPKGRVEESASIFQKLGAAVSLQLYPNFGHSIHEDEIEFINAVLKP